MQKHWSISLVHDGSRVHGVTLSERGGQKHLNFNRDLANFIVWLLLLFDCNFLEYNSKTLECFTGFWENQYSQFSIAELRRICPKNGQEELGPPSDRQPIHYQVPALKMATLTEDNFFENKDVLVTSNAAETVAVRCSGVHHVVFLRLGMFMRLWVVKCSGDCFDHSSSRMSFVRCLVCNLRRLRHRVLCMCMRHTFAACTTCTACTIYARYVRRDSIMTCDSGSLSRMWWLQPPPQP